MATGVWPLVANEPGVLPEPAAGTGRWTSQRKRRGYCRACRRWVGVGPAHPLGLWFWLGGGGWGGGGVQCRFSGVVINGCDDKNIERNDAAGGDDKNVERRGRCRS
jgi:hypothetical protein